MIVSNDRTVFNFVIKRGILLMFIIKGEQMMKRKIIAVSGGLAEMNGFKRAGVSPDYFDAIATSGGAPLMIPMSRDEESIEAALSVCDGLIMSGGVDIDPVHYGQPIHRLCGDVDEYRDAFEYKLLAAAMKLNIPILGICRGIQIINVYFGGSLYQDVTLKSPEVIQHNQKGNRGKGSQTIKVKKGSFLYDVLGDQAYVNSYHHQAIDRLAEGFVVTATAVDGIVEGIEHKEKKIYGVQFHPEMMHREDEKMLSIFKEFINRID